MEDLLPFNHKEISFIRIFFRILLAFFLVILILLFVVPINDSVSFSEGEIIAKNPELDYKAPFEVTLEKNFVKEGDIISKGDTLLVIRSNQLNKNITSSLSEKNSLSIQLNSQEKNLENIDNKIFLANNEITLKKREYKISKERVIEKLNSFNKSIPLIKEKLSIKFKKLKTDSLLFKKDVISLLSLRNSYDEYLNYKRDLIETEKEEKENMIKNHVQLEGNLKIQNEELKYFKSELNKQYVISDIDGVITEIFNEKRDVSYIDKGESLVLVSPLEERFYVKIRIDERDVKYLKTELLVNLKLDAFYYYEHGILQGYISYIPERKKNNNYFDVIVEIPHETKFNLKSGYSVKGEVILERMSLIKYCLKELFKKIDNY